LIVNAPAGILSPGDAAVLLMQAPSIGGGLGEENPIEISGLTR
jgi:hypothetical protein